MPLEWSMRGGSRNGKEDEMKEVTGCLFQPKDRNYKKKGNKRETHLEQMEDGLSYNLRTGQQTMVMFFDDYNSDIRIERKDMETKTKVIGMLDIKGRYESARRVYDPDSLAPTLNSCTGGGLEPKIPVPKPKRLFNIYGDYGTGYAGNVWDDKHIAPGLMTMQGGNREPMVMSRERMEQVRIRKLTPKECWRLMGFDDEDFEKAKKVNSDTQLYKQAGNSIVVDVLMAIFREML